MYRRDVDVLGSKVCHSGNSNSSAIWVRFGYFDWRSGYLDQKVPFIG